MYEVCMSANRRIEPNFDQTPEIWTEEPPICLGPECLVYEEDTSNGIGGLLMKSGLVILFSVMAYGGYQFIKDSNTDQQLANSKPTYDWSGKPTQTNNNGELVALNDQNRTVRKIDLTKTGSIKKITSRIGKPVPIKPKISVNAKFHIVQSGDTLSAIGRKFKISSADIMEINAIENPRKIKPGMKLYISR